MEAPVSWLLIRPGWEVCASDGHKVGEVDEVSGDNTKDIFNGLALATGLLAKPLYVPAEDVARITEGTVHLTLSRQQVEALGEFREPATSARIEVDDRRGAGAELAADARERESGIVRPVQSHEHSMNIWRRMYLAVRRLLRR